MDKKSKILLSIVVLVTFASVGYTFYKTVIKQDFTVNDSIPLKGEDTSQIEEQ